MRIGSIGGSPMGGNRRVALMAQSRFSRKCRGWSQVSVKAVLCIRRCGRVELTYLEMIPFCIRHVTIQPITIHHHISIHRTSIIARSS